MLQQLGGCVDHYSPRVLPVKRDYCNIIAFKLLFCILHHSDKNRLTQFNKHNLKITF